MRKKDLPILIMAGIVLAALLSASGFNMYNQYGTGGADFNGASCSDSNNCWQGNGFFNDVCSIARSNGNGGWGYISNFPKLNIGAGSIRAIAIELVDPDGYPISGLSRSDVTFSGVYDANADPSGNFRGKIMAYYSGNLLSTYCVAHPNQPFKVRLAWYFGSPPELAQYVVVPPAPPAIICGNGLCENGETYVSCPADCIAPSDNQTATNQSTGTPIAQPTFQQETANIGQTIGKSIAQINAGEYNTLALVLLGLILIALFGGLFKKK